MRRLLPLLLPLVLVAACDGGAPPPAAPVAQLRVGFVGSGVADTIRVDAVDRLALRAALLVVPDGTTVPASHLDVAASPSVAIGQFVAGDPWRSALGGASTPAPLLTPQAGAALAGQEQILAMVSSAEITLPDPVSYRRDWRRYRIRLSFGTPPGELETRDIAAPPPPP
jgi:hypothetical protein